MKRRTACTIFFIARNGVAEIMHVDTNLILAAGVKAHLHEVEAAVALQSAIASNGELSRFG